LGKNPNLRFPIRTKNIENSKEIGMKEGPRTKNGKDNLFTK